MVASAVLICACVLQQRDVIGDRFEIIAIVHSETVIEPGTITPDTTLEQLEIVATEKGWSIVKADQLVVLVDARILDLRALKVQANLTAELAAGNGEFPDILDLSKLDENTRLSLSKTLMMSALNWWPLFMKEDLMLRLLPNARIVFETETGPKQHYVDLPIDVSPVPMYSLDLRVGSESARANREGLGFRGNVSSFPRSFSVRVLSSSTRDRWSRVPDAVSAVRAQYMELTSQYDANVAEYLRGLMGGNEVDRLLSAKTGADLPDRILNQLVNSIETRRARFGIPPGVDVRTWVSQTPLRKIRFALFAEFGFVDKLGQKHRVSVQLERGGD